MKRAKIMLSAVAVLAIVGGVFASKANRNTKSLFVTNGTAGSCNLLVKGITLAANDNTPVIRYATEVPGTCTTKSVFPTD